MSIAPREHAAIWTRNIGLAMRRLRRSPAFALAAVFTLALGTGATAAVFSLVNAVLLQPLPWRMPDRVGLIWAVQPSGGRTWLSFPELEELRGETVSFSGVAGFVDLRLHFVAEGIGRELQALAVSHDLFDVLGVTPAVGRTFVREDDHPASAPVVILSESLWTAQFARDAAIVGRSITLNDRPYRVAGVMPATFSILPPSSVIPDRVDVWVPLEPHLPSRDRTVRFLHALARLAGDTTFAEAASELETHAARARAGFPSAYLGGRWGFTVRSFSGDVLENARTALYLLSGLVALVLVMACANVANLVLARGESRRTELAIRTALGAGPVRLSGELLAEALVLAACGGAAGLALAAGAPAILRSIDPGALPRLDGAGVDGTVVVFMLGLVLVSAATFAAVPLVERLRVRNLAILTTGRGGSHTPRSARVGRTLVVAQTMLATTIIITALFLADSFVRLHRVELGFAPERLLTARISLSPKYPAGPRATQFFEQVIAAAEGTGGIDRAAAITQLPLSGAMLGSTFLAGAGLEPQRIDADLRGVTASYFEVVGTPLLLGRRFDENDSAASPAVAIVDESFARRLGADLTVVGRRLRWIRQPEVDIEIVGVVGGIHHRGPAAPARETVYRPHRQYPRTSMFVAARTEQDPSHAAAAVRAAVASVDPSQAVVDISTMEDRVERSMSRARMSVLLAGALAGIAVALGFVGLYGVLSFGVSQRVREFGVRMALGADPARVRRMVLGEGLLLTAAGAVPGAGAAMLLAHSIDSLLYATDVTGAGQYLAGISLVLAFSAAAFWLPARRASAIAPAAVLRSD